MSDSIDKGDLFLFLDLIELFSQPFHGMQGRFAIINHFDSVQRLTFFNERNDLSEQTGLMLCDGFFSDKGVLVCAGFDFVPSMKIVLPEISPRSWSIEETLARTVLEQAGT